MAPLGQTPSWLSPLLQEAQNDPAIRLTDPDLRKRGVDPARARRWFKKHHQMTFQAYLRSLRVSKAFERIKRDGNVTASAFDSGFDSLSGFAEAFKKTTGFSPSESRSQTLIVIKRLLTPIGPLLAGATDDGICLLDFADRGKLETQLTRIQKAFNASIVPGNHALFAELDRQLKTYFAGELKRFSLPLQTPASPFQQSVWKTLQRIPYGDTCSYQEQANAIGNPKAVRAVATANGDNRIVIIIPCHRVIGKDGSLTGYGGGLWRKRYLLDLEARNK